MKTLLASAALAVLLAGPALAQPPSDQPAETPTVTDAPPNTTVVLKNTVVEDTAKATIEKTTEAIIPISPRPLLDPENPIAPEVKAVVASKKHYTTADLAKAQLAAVLATPASEPTTIITTTTTIPKTDS